MKNKLIILGSGTCVSSFYKPFDFRYPSGYLLQSEGINMLLDCSEGIRARLEKVKFDYFKIDYIFISHFHPDHFSLDTFLQAFYVRARKAGQPKKITVFGSSEIERHFSTIWDLKYANGHYQKDFKKILDIDFQEFSDNKEIDRDNKIKITSFRVPHGEMEAYATRFSLGNKSLTYSGDSGDSENLVKAAKNTDLFICEAATEIGKKDPENAHLNPFQAGETAKKANSKALILTHYHGSNPDEAMIKDVRKSGYSGDIFVAKDFQSFYL